MDNTTDKIIKASPFCFMPGMKVMLENKRKSCNPAVIKEAFFKKHFKDIDVYIAKTVMQFEVINKNALTFYINNSKDVPAELKKSDYTRNVHNLVERGVLLRYYVSDGIKNSPYVYTLSKGAYGYFARMFGRSIFSRVREYGVDGAFPCKLLKAAASNQFFARLLVSDSYKIIKFVAGSSLRHKGHRLTLDGELRIKVGDNLLDFAIVCFRNNDTVINDYTLTLEALRRKYKDRAVSVIVLVESLKMANDMERARLSHGPVSELAVFYLPDVVAVNEEPFSSVYMVMPDKTSYDVKEVSFL